MIEQLRPEEYVRRREAGELWQLVDVREPWEIDVARVAEAIHIPMGEIAARRQELDSEHPVAVLCHSGVRSAHVAMFLSQCGFDSVANIAGGIDAWSLEVDGSVPRY